MGQHPQVVLAYGEQSGARDDTDKCQTPKIGMDMPGGHLQIRCPLRLLITAHCGSARWVVWKGLRTKSPHPYPISVGIARADWSACELLKGQVLWLRPAAEDQEPPVQLLAPRQVEAAA